MDFRTNHTKILVIQTSEKYIVDISSFEVLWKFWRCEVTWVTGKGWGPEAWWINIELSCHMPYLLWPWWWWWWHSDEVLVVVFDEEELLRSRLVDEDTRCPAHSRSTPFMATIHDEWRWGGRWSRQQWGQWRPPWGRWQEDHCCHYWPTAFFAPIAYHGKASHKHKADDKVTSCLHLLDRLIKKTASPSSFSAGPAHPMIQQSHYPLSLPHPSIVCTRSWYMFQ